ncbi:MAG: DUF885 domain-containing protein [Mycobacteriaceae bacterium]
MSTALTEFPLITEYLLLGLRFDRLEEGFVDAYTGDPALRGQVNDEPIPDPVVLAHRAAQLRDQIPDSGLPAQRGAFVDVHLKALECSARKFSGQDVGFIEEVSTYFDLNPERIRLGEISVYQHAQDRMDAVLVGSGSLRDRLDHHRCSEEIPSDKLAECVEAFSSALRDIVRAKYELPASEMVQYEVVGDKPWSGFNYYLGNFRSTVAINMDLKQYMSVLPKLIAHESYPGHHTEHCRKEAGLVRGQGQGEQTLFVVNTPQCLMAEGLADLALHAVVGKDWGLWAQDIYADLGLSFDGLRAQELSAASAELLTVRQDAAILLHDRHTSVEEVSNFLQRWTLASDERVQQMLRFLSSPLWRAYTSTYVEGYQLLGQWLEKRPQQVSITERFLRLLDEPLTPSQLRKDIDLAG